MMLNGVTRYMADTSKLTKLNYTGPTASFSCPFPVVASGEDRNTPPPVPWQVTVCPTTAADIETPATMLGLINTALTAAGLGTVDPAL
jgi:hypothetical protein